MKYFTLEEFACRCGCGFDDISHELTQILDKLREHFDQPCTVNSGCRCEAHNKKVGGAPRSQHLLGKAADIRIRGITPALVAEMAIQLGATGTKVYDTFTHVDVRSGAEWHE